MDKQVANRRHKNHPLIILFASFAVLSVLGYILRGSTSHPASHMAESIGVLIGLASGIVFLAWFLLLIIKLIKKVYKK